MEENTRNKFETNAIRTQLERSQNLEHSVPLYLTSSFVFEDSEDMRAPSNLLTASRRLTSEHTLPCMTDN